MVELPQLAVDWRGRESYAQTWQRQLDMHSARRSGLVPDTIMFVEHEPVVTLGKHGDSGNLMVSEDLLKARGFEFHRVERGGDITYHGPGQLVGYPIVSLRERGFSLREYMRGLEQVLIDTAADFGIETTRIPGLTGIWHGDQKLAAIGVAVKGGVSFHGFAFNVHTDLSHFDLIVPCGITDRRVGSLRALGAEDATLDQAMDSALRHFRQQFGYSCTSS